MDNIENQVTDVVLTEKPEVDENVSPLGMDAELERMLNRFKPAKWIRAITKYVTEDGETRQFLDYRKLERNKYAPWGRGEFA